MNEFCLGDFVVISEGQTMLLDMNTPVLSMLLIKGGNLIFDRKDVHLQAENILIVNNGTFMIGTKEEPFQQKAKITLHGHVRSKELPIYGAKALALREGKLGLYGKPLINTWTRISHTVNPGDFTMNLIFAVPDWKVGDEIVIAATGKSIRENEVIFITGISNNGQTIHFKPALKYKHVSISQTIAGRVIDTRAEVGLLTRNIVVQGSKHAEWNEVIENCPAEFDPGQFATQTCFDGRFGEERGSDQFGVQIMVHSHSKSKGLAIAHFDHIEVTHAGQAFRLGRYPIHFHMDGDVYGSYVNGSSIHRSFNRAITIHGVHNLVVHRNVVYDALGKELEFIQFERSRVLYRYICSI